ncbi:hypothetical protein VPH35_027035 [Triticum aestivum]
MAESPLPRWAPTPSPTRPLQSTTSSSTAMVSWRGRSAWPSSPIFFPRCLSNSEQWEASPADGEVDNVELGVAGVFLKWQDLSVTVINGRKGHAVVLDGLSGYARPGEVLALMGPSGCGKTTLLDALAGRLRPNMKGRGDILINGCRQKVASGTSSAYVTQENMLMATLTVAEAVHYSAQLQLPDSLTPAEKRSWADDVIRQMRLATVAGTRMGGRVCKGISGGQRKRASICIELLASPALIFLDEPTSGLDSVASYHVMSRIAAIARRNGTTVVAAIHQPSTEVFELFHGLCLLANGRAVYFGPTSKAIERFSEPLYFLCARTELPWGWSTLVLLFISHPMLTNFQTICDSLFGCSKNFLDTLATHSYWQFFDANGFPCPLRRNPSDHFLRMINIDFEARASMFMFTSTFMTMMAIGAFPSFVEDMKVGIIIISKTSLLWFCDFLLHDNLENADI